MTRANEHVDELPAGPNLIIALGARPGLITVLDCERINSVEG